MTNDLLRNWHLRIKFVDDTTALEILPRNGVSFLNHAVSNIHQFSSEHNMRLNPKKCKEMLVNSMHNRNFSLRSVFIGCNTVERVNTYKLLGAIICDDLRWVHHIECISKKASKRLHSVGFLKREVVAGDSILTVYLTTIRPILEYGVQVWQDIPQFLSRKLESIQKRALCIIYSSHIYDNALSSSDRSSKMTSSCKKVAQKVRNQFSLGWLFKRSLTYAARGLASL